MHKNIIILGALTLVSVHSVSSYTPNIEQINSAILLQNQNIIKSDSSGITGINLEKIKNEDPERYIAFIDSFIKETKLGDNITRREMLKIVVNLSGKNTRNHCEGIFKDIIQDDWGCKYIESALTSGIIAPSDIFRPDDTITKIEALKLILKSKGIEKFVETKDWKKDYVDTAFQYGIITSKFYDYDSTPNRAWIFDIAATTITKKDLIRQRSNQKLISDEAL